MRQAESKHRGMLDAEREEERERERAHEMMSRTKLQKEVGRRGIRQTKDDEKRESN